MSVHGDVEYISTALLMCLDTVDIDADAPAQDDFRRLVADKQYRVRQLPLYPRRKWLCDTQTTTTLPVRRGGALARRGVFREDQVRPITGDTVVRIGRRIRPLIPSATHDVRGRPIPEVGGEPGGHEYGNCRWNKSPQLYPMSVNSSVGNP